MRYQHVKLGRHDLFINGRGQVVVLDFITAPNVASARRYYMANEHFDSSHASAMACVRSAFGTNQSQFDDSFFLSLISPNAGVDWNETHLAVEHQGDWQFQIFLEALFAYGLCRSAEHGLTRLLDGSSASVISADIVEYTKDLLAIERPEYFLVNADEIKLMEQFYGAWKINEAIASLKSRFSQAIDAYNLYFNNLQTQRTMSLNRIVGAAAVLALLSATAAFEQFLPDALDALVRPAIIGGGVLLLILAVWTEFKPRLDRYLWRRKTDWRIEKQLKRLRT
jgi:hypothetical protein